MYIQGTSKGCPPSKHDRKGPFLVYFWHEMAEMANGLPFDCLEMAHFPVYSNGPIITDTEMALKWPFSGTPILILKWPNLGPLLARWGAIYH